MKKLALGMLYATTLTVLTITPISPMGVSAAKVTSDTKVYSPSHPTTNHSRPPQPPQPPSIASNEPAGWVESVTDSKGGGTFAQVPFNVQFSSDNAASNLKDYGYRPNVPVVLNFNFKGMEDDSLYLRKPVAFTIQITNVKTKKVVWTGRTPAIAVGDFSSWKKFMTLNFNWAQKDAKGKRVVPGDYKANVIGPVTISYSKEKDSKVLTQTLNLSTINRGGVDIHIKAK